MVIVWRKRDREIRRLVAGRMDLAGLDLSGARLVDMDLRGKDLRGANLARSDLTESDLEGADLRESNLRGAFLTGSQLVRATLDGACLDGAYLIATNFRHASFVGVTAAGAIWDQATTWPNGEHSANPRALRGA